MTPLRPFAAARPRSPRLAALTARTMLAAAAALLFGAAGPLFAQATSPGARSADGAWTLLAPAELDARRASERVRPWVRPDAFAAVEVDAAALEVLLDAAPMESTPAARSGGSATLRLPRPDGTFEAFEVVESPVMEPGLEAWFVEQGFAMRTYKVRSLERPATLGRIDWGGPHGFHAALRSPEDGQWYIDPYWQFDDRLHVAYRRRDLTPRPEQLAWRCETDAPAPPLDPDLVAMAEETMRGSGLALRTYRFAKAATGEYTQFHGGTVLDGMAALVTATNRINEVYEIDLGVRLVLVANNNLIVYTNSTTDPYTDGNTSTMITQNRTNLMATIGDANYDVGHVVGASGSGGLAGAIGNVCRTGTGGSASPHKAQGATTRSSPIGDPFDIDYTAHEIGHQFAGQHTWNYCGGGSGHGLAMEPGSGITIMGYAGLCGADDLAANSIAMFHVGNIIEINAYIAGFGPCHGSTPTSNAAAPTIDAGASYTIPANTPFELTALSVGDADGDSVTVSWEQVDSGVFGSQATLANGPNVTSGPVFRAHLPTTGATQSFPRASAVLAGAPFPVGERPTTVTRTMQFRAVARDNNAEVGRVAHDVTTLTSAASTGFAVTSPDGGESLSAGAANITWSVASTSSSPVNAAGVDVYLSTDGGATFPTLLATNLPNTGSGSITLPNVVTSSARLKIKGTGNVFYDVSDGDFSIIGILPYFEASGSLAYADDAPGLGNGNGFLEPDESQIALTLGVSNVGSLGATGVTAVLSSLTPTVTITTAGPIAYPDLASGGGDGDNVAPFAFAIADTHACGAPIQLRLAVTSNEGANHFDFSLPTGETIVGVPLPEEGFEAASLPAGWVWTATSGPSRWGARTDAASLATPAAGSYLASYETPFSNVVDSRLMTPEVTGATQLTFWHTYDVEQQNTTVGYDGLVIEVTTNNGANWTPLDAEITTGGYTRTANGGFGSPLAAGRACWSGSAPSFPAMTQVVVDLSAYAGQTIRVGFRYTEDNCCSGSESGWFIDRVAMTGVTYVCAPVPVELSGFLLE